MTPFDDAHCYAFAPATAGQPLGKMRAWLRARLSDQTSDLVDDAQLVATELVANADEHGAGATVLRLSRPAGRHVVRIEVDDATPHLAVDSGEPSARQLGGRGLTLVVALSRAWGVRRATRHKTVWAELTLS